MVREDKSTWKANYFTKLAELLEEYPRCFIVGADNVGSKQMQEIRIALRGKAVVLMGKNTMMRKVIRGQLEKNPELEKLLPHIKMNVGFVFTNEELTTVRDLLLSNKKAAPAKAGAIAPVDVTIPAQNTGMGPEKTSFFQTFRGTAVDHSFGSTAFEYHRLEGHSIPLTAPVCTLSQRMTKNLAILTEFKP